jgi:hypothetical protein
MKLNRILLAVALGAIPFCGIAAPPTTQNPSASNTAIKNILPTKAKTIPADKYKIERVGKMSSRPWAEIVGSRPGVSQFPDAENHEPQLTLTSVRF